MRNDQTGLVEHGVSVQDEVQIERSRRTGMGSYTPVSQFDGQKRVEEVARSQIGDADRCGIQEAGLVADTNWIGVVKGGDAQFTDQGGE